MKFIHMADMHFDAPFTIINEKSNLGIIRRLEQREVFKKAIDYIKQNNIEYLFISGDLYEHEYVKDTTIEYINNLFKTIPNTKIFIAPGNHDPLLKNSQYNTFNWNENVYIFEAEVTNIEFDEVDIYGFGFDNFYCENSGIENIKIKNKDKINILVAHASLDASKTINEQYNSISSKKVKEIGFNYIALGHIHKTNYEEEEYLIYPGSTISLGFDELGEHGIVEGEITKDKINKKFIKLDNRIFEEIEFDISNINSEEELIEKINEIKIDKNNLYKIILTGNKTFKFNLININKLNLNENIIKIKNNSKINYNLELISKENNLKGIFVKKMLEKIKENPEKKELIEQSIEIGLDTM